MQKQHKHKKHSMSLRAWASKEPKALYNPITKRRMPKPKGKKLKFDGSLNWETYLGS